MPRLCLIVAALPVIAWADPRPQDPNSAQPGQISAVAQKAEKLLRASESFKNWDREAENVIDAAERVYELNGWDTEADYFSLDLFREISQLPPWDVYGRFGVFLDRVGDRYVLTDDQRETLQNLVVNGATEIFSKHSDRILSYAMEAIETRASGRPFTQDQVARWAALSEPVFQDMRRVLDKGGGEFLSQLEPEQRELVREDMQATDRRLDTVQRGYAAWKRGEWDPAQWGLDGDPIQDPHGVAIPDRSRRVSRGAAGEIEPPPEPPGGSELPPGREEQPGTPPDAPPAPEKARTPGTTPELDAVGRFVEAFIRKYQLNDEQAQRAHLYGDDVRKRIDAVEARYTRVASAKTGDEAKQGAQQRRVGDLKTLFEMLQRRLERLPTRAQRREALSVELPLPPEISPGKPVGQTRGEKP